MHLSELIRKFRAQVSFTIILILIEKILHGFVEPYLLGNVIDALIDKEFTSPFHGCFLAYIYLGNALFA